MNAGGKYFYILNSMSLTLMSSFDLALPSCKLFTYKALLKAFLENYFERILSYKKLSFEKYAH